MEAIGCRRVFASKEAEKVGGGVKKVSFPVGLTIEFEGDVKVFYSYAHKTLSVSYPGAVKKYRSGGVVEDSEGRAEYGERRRNKGMGVREFGRAYGEAFAREVLYWVAVGPM